MNLDTLAGPRPVGPSMGWRTHRGCPISGLPAPPMVNYGFVLAEQRESGTSSAPPDRGGVRTLGMVTTRLSSPSPWFKRTDGRDGGTCGDLLRPSMARRCNIFWAQFPGLDGTGSQW